MFDNVVRLIGFVGSDAELKTTKTQREFTVLSLATTASWKDKNGDGYIRRTEWHRLVAWGNLSTFAATLKKGAHVSVEGELRYREFVPKRQKKSKNGDEKVRVAEIHLSKLAAARPCSACKPSERYPRTRCLHRPIASDLCTALRHLVINSPAHCSHLDFSEVLECPCYSGSSVQWFCSFSNPSLLSRLRKSPRLRWHKTLRRHPTIQ